MPIILFGVVSLACGLMASPTQVITPPAHPTAQQQAQDSTGVLKTSDIQPTNTLAFPASSPMPNLPPSEILSHQNYIDGEWFHIVGEVRNNTNVPMEYVKIVATLFDNNNKVVGTDFTYTELDIIPPGGKSPFVTGTDEWTGVTTYKLQVQGREGTLGRQDLGILDHSSYQDGEWLHIRGQVQNTGTTPAEFVKLVVTFYNASGNVVSTDFTYTTLDTIPAGETSPFETGTDYWPNFDYYEIQVQGR
jgi:hypothetical protein